MFRNKRYPARQQKQGTGQWLTAVVAGSSLIAGFTFASPAVGETPSPTIGWTPIPIRVDSPETPPANEARPADTSQRFLHAFSSVLAEQPSSAWQNSRPQPWPTISRFDDDPAPAPFLNTIGALPKATAPTALRCGFEAEQSRLLLRLKQQEQATPLPAAQ